METLTLNLTTFLLSSFIKLLKKAKKANEIVKHAFNGFELKKLNKSEIIGMLCCGFVLVTLLTYNLRNFLHEYKSK